MLEVHLLQCPLEACHLQVLLLLKGLGEREEGAVGRDTLLAPRRMDSKM